MDKLVNQLVMVQLMVDKGIHVYIPLIDEAAYFKKAGSSTNG